MSNNFLVFDSNKVGMMSDSDYLASSYRKDGVQAGIAPRDIHNKLYYQISLFVSALAESLSDRGFTVSDTSFGTLKTVLDNIALKSDLSGSWVANTSYSVGDIIYPLSELNSYKRMECVVAGTSGTLEPTWTAVGTMVTDGGVTWIVDDRRDGTPVGRSVLEHTTAARPGYVEMSGQIVNRADYPRLWAWVQAYGNLVSEATWSGGVIGAFSSGNGSTTFRLPEGRAEFFRGWDNSRGVDAARTLGSAQSSANLSHSHGYKDIFFVQEAITGFESDPHTFEHAVRGDYDYDNSNIYGNQISRTSGLAGGTESRPRNVALLACIKY